MPRSLRCRANPIQRRLSCALKLWPALTRYPDDGRIEIDNSAAERALRAGLRSRCPHRPVASTVVCYRWVATSAFASVSCLSVDYSYTHDRDY